MKKDILKIIKDELWIPGNRPTDTELLTASLLNAALDRITTKVTEYFDEIDREPRSGFQLTDKLK